MCRNGSTDQPQPEDRHSRYWTAVGDEDRALDVRLADISRRQDAGEFTTLEAAQQRIEALEAHLSEVRHLRQQYLEGGD